MTRVEVLAGMRVDEAQVTRELLNSIESIAVDVAGADVAGRLANRYLRSHPGVDTVDYVIAATATVHGCALWTRNLRHFPMFAGLRPPS